MSPALIRLENASFGYRRHPVVSGVDLEISRGDFVAIAGPNGGGKTTLFRGILGLLPALEGSVELGTDRVGYIPQREQLDRVYPLSVEEIVQMGGYGRLRGLRTLSKKQHDYAVECLREVGLADRRRLPFASLSGGQRQRVLIARALMVQPELLLLDEPTSGVDRSAAAHILSLLGRLNRERGLAVLLVAHQFEMVLEYARDALWVDEGRVQRGSAAVLLDPLAWQERRALVPDGQPSRAEHV